MKRVGERKIRSDKKREVKPTIAPTLKDAIYRISYITYTPVKDVCEYLCIAAISNQKVLDHLSQFFRRDMRVGNTMYFGSLDNQHVQKRIRSNTERVTVRFKRNDYEFIYKLGYALDCSPTRVVAVLLHVAMREMNNVNDYIKRYLDGELSEIQMRELRNLMRYTNAISEVQHTWASLLGYIFDEVSAPVSRIKDAVAEFFSRDDD